MAEENKPVTTTGENSSGTKNTAEVTFGEKTYTLHKLKAGKFYDALKVYMDMVKDIAPEAQVPGKEATVDFDKLIVSMFQSWPEKMVKFIAVCCSTVEIKEGEKPLTSQSILEDAYPEQIPDAFSVCLKLNNVAANLKNFVAPIGELGAGFQAKQQPSK
jgi:hypothetical protein